MKDKIERLIEIYRVQIEAQKSAAMKAAGSGQNVELLLVVGQVLNKVNDDLKGILKETEDAAEA